MFVFYDDDEENQQIHLTPYEELRVFIVSTILTIIILAVTVYIGLTI